MLRRGSILRIRERLFRDALPQAAAPDAPLGKRVRRKLVPLRNVSPWILAVPPVLTIIMLSSNFGRQGRNQVVSELLMTDDPCKTAAPPQTPPVFFDLDAGPGELAGDTAYLAGGGAPARPAVFQTFSEEGLFTHGTDAGSNSSSANFDLTYDEVVNRELALRVLREYYNAPSLQMRGVWTTFIHVDRWRAQFVLRTRLLKDKSTHPDAPEDITNIPPVPQSNRVVISRKFAGGCKVAVVPEVKDIDRPPIYVVVAYSGTGWGRPQRMSRFIMQLEMIQAHPLLKDKQEVNLIVSLHDMTEKAFRKLMELEDAYAHLSVVVIEPPVTSGNRIVPFSRGATLRVGIEKSLIPDDSLIFLSDVDMQIYPSFFSSCRAGAIMGSQIYFPVPYNLFPGEEEIRPGAGFFDLNSTGMACMYKVDFDKARPWRRPYTDSNIKYTGPGMEDEDFMDAVAGMPSDYRIFRAVEPSLRHTWHMKVCRWNMIRRNDCMLDAYKALGVSALVGRMYVETTDQDLQWGFREFDEDWDPKEKAITLKRSNNRDFDELGNPPHRQRWW